MLKFKVETKYDLSKLNKIIGEISNEYYIKVGIIGESKNKRNEDGLTNSEVGKVHEYGSVTKNIPERSFLRMPIFSKSKEIVQIAQKLINDALKSNQFNKIQILKKLGKACENFIRDAFNTGGFGKWKALSQNRLDNKSGANKNKPLVDTTQLRESITSAVEKD